MHAFFVFCNHLSHKKKLNWYLPVPGKKKLEFVACDSFKMLGDRNHVSNVVALRGM